MLPMVCGWEYFPDRKGLVTGIAIGAYGFSSFVFNPIITMMINPNNREAKIVINDDLTFFEEDIARRVPGTIRMLVLIWTFLVVLSALLISRPIIPYRTLLWIALATAETKPATRIME